MLRCYHGPRNTAINMTKQTRLYQVLGYAGVIPFLVGTFFTWCGPMQETIYAAELFIVYSVVVLSFLAGSWWGFSLPQGQTTRATLVVGSCVYALFAAGSWLIGYQPLTLILLGIGYVAIWLHEFFMPVSDGSGAYRIMRTLLTLTVFVCHLLVAMQIYTL